MKKIFTLVAAALLVAAPALFTSCDDDPWYDDEPWWYGNDEPWWYGYGDGDYATPMVTTGRRVLSMPI